MSDNTLNTARATALSQITPAPKGRLRWRVTLTDSESLIGVAPVCDQPGSDALHEIPDYPGGSKRDQDGVYDCCPWPQFDTYSEATATYVVALLNADTEGAAAADGQAYDGELAMLRSLVRTLRAVVRDDREEVAQREVRRLLYEHAADERAAYGRQAADSAESPREGGAWWPRRSPAAHTSSPP